ncbi:MAG: substrate-binding domain-containing protein [Pseudomonadota bacterium]|nr:substrate-binding domain-containing protein [Pseudomonadota bacterium]
MLLSQGANNPAAQAFMTFLTSDEAQEIIQAFGYAVP